LRLSENKNQKGTLPMETVKTQGLDETAAENAAVAMMKKLPAWKDMM
jgi:hypothetical protein